MKILLWFKRKKVSPIVLIIALIGLILLAISPIFVDVKKSPVKLRKIKQIKPQIRLFINDGSERSTYMPQEKILQWLGIPHSGINLMACYYPKQSFWPERKLFSKEVPHYRHSIKDETKTTKLKDPNDWTDGYYSFDIDNPRNDVVCQMEDVRRFGQDIRLTLTTDIDTSDTDLKRIAEILKDFGPVELRLNHETNGNTWFRFAKNVGAINLEPQRQLYYDISQFFIRTYEIMKENAPNVTMIACYNGPAKPIQLNKEKSYELPQLSDNELGLMYRLPNTTISLDQYGSLHYGWPGHVIKNPPVIGVVTNEQHQSFALKSDELCNGIIMQFQKAISELRSEKVRIDLGELDFDEDIHGPKIRAQLVKECYSWIQKHPEVVGSVIFYELTDMAGLGLLRQREYESLDDVIPNQPLLDIYKNIMCWDKFRAPVEDIGPIEAGVESVKLLWRSAIDAEGIELALNNSSKIIDFKSTYWRRIKFLDADGKETYVHTDAEQVSIPKGTQKVHVFALPPDGRNNCAKGYRMEIPIPVIIY